LGAGDLLSTPYAVSQSTQTSFELQVPANQVGASLPASAVVRYYVPGAGDDYTVYSGGSVALG